MEKLKLKKELKAKILKIASEILTMHGSIVGDRFCQDWSGEEKYNPSTFFNKEEREIVNYNYEIYNSNLNDYDKEFDGLHDEMVASFVIGEMVRDILKEDFDDVI